MKRLDALVSQCPGIRQIFRRIPEAQSPRPRPKTTIVRSHGGPPKWLVYKGKSHLHMVVTGVPLFQETTKYSESIKLGAFPDWHEALSCQG